MIDRKRWLSLALGIVVSGLFLYLTLRKVDLDAVLQASASVHLGILSLTVVTKGLGFGFMAARSKGLFDPLHTLSLRTQFTSVLMGFLGNNALPFRLGELLRTGYLVRRSGVPAESVLAVVALERLLDAFCLLMLFFVLLPAMTVVDTPGTGLLTVGGLLVCMVGGAVVAARFPRRSLDVLSKVLTPMGGVGRAVQSRAERFLNGLSALSTSGGLARALGTSLSYWGFTILNVQIWIWAFGLSLPWYAPLVVTCFLAFGTLFPSAPAFVGTYHWFAAAALGVFGVPEEVAVSVAIVGHATAFVPWTVLGLGFVTAVGGSPDESLTDA